MGRESPMEYAYSSTRLGDLAISPASPLSGGSQFGEFVTRRGLQPDLRDCAMKFAAAVAFPAAAGQSQASGHLQYVAGALPATRNGRSDVAQRLQR